MGRVATSKVDFEFRKAYFESLSKMYDRFGETKVAITFAKSAGDFAQVFRLENK